MRQVSFILPISRCRGSNSRQYERNAWFKPLAHAAAGAGIAATLPFEWSERLRESKPGSVLLSDDIIVPAPPSVQIAFARAPFAITYFDCAGVKSLADDRVRTGVCKLSSSLCCYDWLSMSEFFRFGNKIFDFGSHKNLIRDGVFDRWPTAFSSRSREIAQRSRCAEHILFFTFWRFERTHKVAGDNKKLRAAIRPPVKAFCSKDTCLNSIGPYQPTERRRVASAMRSSGSLCALKKHASPALCIILFLLGAHAHAHAHTHTHTHFVD